MLERLGGLVKAGWKAVTEAHTLHWVLSGLGVPAAVPAFVGWDTPEQRALTVGISLLLWCFFFLCALAYVGHRTIPVVAAEPPSEFVSMREATTFAYDQLLDCGHTLWPLAAERLYQGQNISREEGIILYFATHFGRHMPIYGKRAPSQQMRLIEGDEFGRGAFGEKGNIFHYHGEKDPRYTDVSVMRKDLSAMIEDMKKDSA